MADILFRKAIPSDMKDILQLQVNVFKGEQKIPNSMIPLTDDIPQQWWCAVMDTEIVGTVAAWQENGEIHWGRFAIKPDLRGRHIGSRLARFSLDDIFSQPINQIFMEAREVTAKIICGMGGKITGEPTEFFVGTVTPILLSKQDYIHSNK